MLSASSYGGEYGRTGLATLSGQTVAEASHKTGECVPGTRAVDIDGSSITSASNAEVDPVTATGSAVAASGRCIRSLHPVTQ